MISRRARTAGYDVVARTSSPRETTCSADSVTRPSGRVFASGFSRLVSLGGQDPRRDETGPLSVALGSPDPPPPPGGDSPLPLTPRVSVRRPCSGAVHAGDAVALTCATRRGPRTCRGEQNARATEWLSRRAGGRARARTAKTSVPRGAEGLRWRGGLRWRDDDDDDPPEDNAKGRARTRDDGCCPDAATAGRIGFSFVGVTDVLLLLLTTLTARDGATT